MKPRSTNSTPRPKPVRSAAKPRRRKPVIITKADELFEALRQELGL